MPEAYGTQRLLLAARDPNWLYAHWDLTREQLQEYCADSQHGHLVLRVYQEPSATPCNEIHVHPTSRNWFVRVTTPGARYQAELGYYPRDGQPWISVTCSAPTSTPPSSMSGDTSVEFKTLPMDERFRHMVDVARRVSYQDTTIETAVEQLQAQGFREVPAGASGSESGQTAGKEQALAELVVLEATRRVWMGSFEITELIRRHMRKELLPSELSLGWSGHMPAISSPAGGLGRPGFWFDVNADLLIYGATEPDATLSIAGRPVQLRPDGSFSFRFALPDGAYALPVQATSADGTETRRATLQISRQTEYVGQVGAHPREPGLKPPAPESLG